MTVDVRQLLENAGVVVNRVESTGWAMVVCPFHDDRSPSLAVNTRNGGWRCFANCGSGSLLDLATRLAQLGRIGNLDLLAVLDDTPGSVPAYSDNRVRNVLALLHDTPPPTEEWLRAMLPHCDYLGNRGITHAVAAEYGLRYDMSEQRVLIPIRTHTGRLMGVEARETRSNAFLRYHPVYRCEKSNWVWGGWRVQFPSAVVVFEGALGACRAAALGVHHAVATLTAHASATQLAWLAQASAVTVCYDPDHAGETGGKGVLLELAAATRVRRVRLPVDIDEITSEVLLNIVYGSGR